VAANNDVDIERIELDPAADSAMRVDSEPTAADDSLREIEEAAEKSYRIKVRQLDAAAGGD
jgi:hypothetical protein